MKYDFRFTKIQIRLFYIIFLFNRVTVDYHFPSQKTDTEYQKVSIIQKEKWSSNKIKKHNRTRQYI
uniref:Uncharacterized protein n=1 Tax=Anguilla anguilla TaxID=7936 RepID=A0A0E9PVM0_ANGAN